MKYIVMECNPAYSILMDEESRFVRAANLHYETGQVVEDPILMDDGSDKKPKITVSHNVIKIVSAVAACLVLVLGIGIFNRSGYDVYSTITVSAAEAEIDLELDSDGNVVSMKGANARGKEFMKNYSFKKGCDRLTAERELVEKLTECGYVKSGDTLNFYIDTPETQHFDCYSGEIMDIVNCMQSDDMCLKAQVHNNKGKGSGHIKTTQAVITAPKNTDSVTVSTTAAVSDQIGQPIQTSQTVLNNQNGHNNWGYHGGQNIPNNKPAITKPNIQDNLPKITTPANRPNDKDTNIPKPAVPGNMDGNQQRPTLPSNDSDLEDNVLPGGNDNWNNDNWHDNDHDHNTDKPWGPEHNEHDQNWQNPNDQQRPQNWQDQNQNWYYKEHDRWNIYSSDDTINENMSGSEQTYNDNNNSANMPSNEQAQQPGS